MKNKKERAKVCRLQIGAKHRGRTFTNGVKVKDEDGNTIFLNATPKTNWDAELAKVSR